MRNHVDLVAMSLVKWRNGEKKYILVSIIDLPCSGGTNMNYFSSDLLHLSQTVLS
jgi:hypothetical protein